MRLALQQGFVRFFQVHRGQELVVSPGAPMVITRVCVPLEVREDTSGRGQPWACRLRLAVRTHHPNGEASSAFPASTIAYLVPTQVCHISLLMRLRADDWILVITPDRQQYFGY